MAARGAIARHDRWAWWRPALLVVVISAFTPPSAPTLGQQLVASGHTLDNNLQLGSGGYNSPVGGRGGRGGAAGLYGQQIYHSRVGQREYYRDAFNRERHYDAARSSAYSSTSHIGSWTHEGEAAGDNRFGAGYDAGYEAGLVDAQEQAELSEQGKHQMEAISYAIGYFLGEEVRAGLEEDDVVADTDSVTQGFRDGLFGNVSPIPRAELEEVLADLQEEVEQRLVQRLLVDEPEFQMLHDRNLARSREFHDEFGRREGVVTLPEGIQLKVLQLGAGPRPGPDDTVVLSYKVLLLDGTVVEEGANEEVRVGAIVDGGALVIQMMNVGSRWLVAIPPELAHGPGGRFPDIAPNETLFGEVELLEIKP
jgi:FKBP-type peptidyl-prolyl cis-trans isomerase